MAYCECDVSYTLSSSSPGEAPFRGLMGRIEKRPVIGASCYLLTTATKLAGPLFLQETGNLCAHVKVCRGVCMCMCANVCVNVKNYIYMQMHVSVSACVCVI